QVVHADQRVVGDAGAVEVDGDRGPAVHGDAVRVPPAGDGQARALPHPAARTDPHLRGGAVAQDVVREPAPLVDRRDGRRGRGRLRGRRCGGRRRCRGGRGRRGRLRARGRAGRGAGGRPGRGGWRRGPGGRRRRGGRRGRGGAARGGRGAWRRGPGGGGRWGGRRGGGGRDLGGRGRLFLLDHGGRGGRRGPRSLGRGLAAGQGDRDGRGSRHRRHPGRDARLRRR